MSKKVIEFIEKEAVYKIDRNTALIFLFIGLFNLFSLFYNAVFLNKSLPWWLTLPMIWICLACLYLYTVNMDKANQNLWRQALGESLLPHLVP